MFYIQRFDRGNKKKIKSHVAKERRTCDNIHTEY